MERTACTHCGEVAPENARYCPQCGSSLDRSSTGGPTQASSPGTTLTDPMAAFFIYLVPFLGPLFALFVSPYKERELLRFHAWQALFFCILYIGLSIAVGIVSLPLTFIGVPLGAGLLGLIHLVFFVAWAYLLFRTVTGQPARLPYLAELADEQARRQP